MERATLEREIRAVGNRGRRRSLLRNLTLVWLVACAAAWIIFLVARSRGVAWPGGVASKRWAMSCCTTPVADTSVMPSHFFVTTSSPSR